jgi:hypothetical protein
VVACVYPRDGPHGSLDLWGWHQRETITIDTLIHVHAV